MEIVELKNVTKKNINGSLVRLNSKIEMIQDRIIELDRTISSPNLKNRKYTKNK